MLKKINTKCQTRFLVEKTLQENSKFMIGPSFQMGGKGGEEKQTERKKCINNIDS